MIILLQSVTIQFRRLFWHISYYKVRQSNFITKCDRLLLQSASGITKYDRLLLQSALGVTKCDRLYYKVRQVLQSVAVITTKKFKNIDDVHLLYLVSDDIKIMIGYKTNEIVHDLFQTLLTRYQQGLETSLKASTLVFIDIEEIPYKFHKISWNHDGSYIDTLKWIKIKRSTINPKNKDNKCFQRSILAALNYKEKKNIWNK